MLHALLFLSLSIGALMATPQTSVPSYQRPVEMLITIDPPSPPKRLTPVAESEALVSNKTLVKAIPVARQPTRLPGDRRLPIVSSVVPPVYPKSALNNQWQGTVKLRLSLTAEGTIESLHVIQSTGYSVLDQSFIRTVRQYYRFKPKRVMGENKASSKVVQYTFSLGST